MKITYFKLPFFIMFAALSFWGCKKEDKDLNPDSDQSLEIQTRGYLFIDSDISRVDEDIREADSKGSFLRTSRCYNVEFATDTLNPVHGFEEGYRKFVLNYSGGCDSLNRTGKITVYKSGSILMGNYKDSVIFEAFFTNGRAISGYKAYHLISTGLTKLEVSFSTNVNVIRNGSSDVNLLSSGKRVYINYLTPLLASVEISGQSIYKDSNGQIVNMIINTPLNFKNYCIGGFGFPVEGSATYSNAASGTTVLVDYGNGDCDRIASLLINNSKASKTIVVNP